MQSSSPTMDRSYGRAVKAAVVAGVGAVTVAVRTCP